jgi:beta-mannosidase
MVWQDFMFACAAYPEGEDFLKEVMEEVEQNINRLQYHPAIAIWCGNNENEWIWYRDGCGKIYKMPGYSIFHKHIPELLKQLDPVRPYWPTTPFGNEDDPNDPASGNRHVWDIWSQWVDYTEISKDKSHFVTEFGFQSPANYSTLSDVIPKSEMNPHSRQFEFHNKQHEGAERLIRFLAGHLPIQTRIKDYIYLTQLNQGLALKCCLEHWRLRWPETNGNIIWQLNDCWPVTSWSLIDSKGLPKLAYYFVKRAFSPQLIAFQYEKEQINLVISNQSAEIFSGYAELYQISSENGRILNSKTISVEVKSQAIKNIMQMAGTALIEDGKQILVARLLNVSRKQLHINYFHGSRWKFVKLNKSEINLDYANNRIELTSPSCAFFVTLQHPNLIFADNGIILIPGEKFTMSVIGGTLSAEQIKNIKVNTLNHYLA